jgi:hypothetical protein
MTVRSDHDSGTELYVNQTCSRCVIRTGMTKFKFLAFRYGLDTAGKRKCVVFYVLISPKKAEFEH